MIYKLRHLSSGVPYLVRPGKNVIGRSSEADIQIDDESISRRHAQIENNGTILFLRDLGSTNGTFLSEQFVSAPVMVEVGSLIQIGEVNFRLDPESGEQEPNPPVVSWQSYQRATNKVPKYQLPPGEEFPKAKSPATANTAWGPVVSLPQRRENLVPTNVGDGMKDANRIAGLKVMQDSSATSWVYISSAFCAGIVLGLITGLVLAKFLFMK